MTTEATLTSEIIEASDSFIEDAVTYADPMVLRGLLYQLTGDPEIASTAVTPKWSGMFEALSVDSEDDVALLQRKAADFLKGHRDSGAGPLPIGPSDRLPTSVDLALGMSLPPEAAKVWLEELALEPFARGLDWGTEPPDRRTNFTVVVIGTGLGGLNAALYLKRAGIPFTVLEKNSGVGGTWYENRYPGCRVDSPSRSYNHLYGVDFEVPYPFGPQERNEKYHNWIADEFDLRGHITHNAEVRSMTWNDSSATWTLVVDQDGTERSIEANAVISAVGFLNRPNIPEIEGLDDFEGASWHTARWPEGFDHAGKRLAVIGTGCTGYQMVPEIALTAEHVTVFQRTPQWIFAVPGYRSPYPSQVGWLDRNLPYHRNFVRLRATHGSVNGFIAATTIDPDFKDPHARSAFNKRVRDACIEFLNHKLGDPELVRTMTPTHPPHSARPVMVDPTYSILDAIQEESVNLVTSGIRRITRTGIETNDGDIIEVDAIVFATGFHASDYLFPMTVTGRGGVTLEAAWADGGPRAHRFTMVPGFPNLFMMYGPNTNGPLNVPQLQELVTAYTLECIGRLIADGKRFIEPRQDAHVRFNELIDSRNSGRLWSDTRAHNYWDQKSLGRSAVMCPLTVPEVYALLRHPDFTELEIT